MDNPLSICLVAAALPATIAAAQQILQESPYKEIRLLRCGFNNGILTITGQVSSFYLKQLTYMALQQVDGVEQIEDMIEVSK